MVIEEKFIEDIKNMLNTSMEINLDTDLLDIEEWDSFSKVSFMAMVNEKYNINLPRFEVASAETVGDLYSIVQDYSD